MAYMPFHGVPWRTYTSPPIKSELKIKPREDRTVRGPWPPAGMAAPHRKIPSHRKSNQEKAGRGPSEAHGQQLRWLPPCCALQQPRECVDVGSGRRRQVCYCWPCSRLTSSVQGRRGAGRTLDGSVCFVLWLRRSSATTNTHV